VTAIPSASHVSFEEWTGRRELPTFGTNAGAAEMPFQGWRRFKEAFAPELVRRAVEETGHVEHLVDPFGGSGTAALAAQFLGVQPSTIEVNPFLADLIEAKIGRYDLKAVVRAYAEVVARVQDGPEANPTEMLAAVPATFIEPGIKGRFLFPREIAVRICTYRKAIEAVDDEASRRLFKVLLAAASVPASHALVSRKGRRYRRRWREAVADAGVVDRLFEQGLLSALFDLRRFEARRCRDYRILRGDARMLTAQLGETDLAVFSPPYPNSFDYTDVYNIELWMLGYLTSATCNRSLREATLRSHVQIKREFRSSRRPGPTLERTVDALDAARRRLWDRNIPEMIAAYFDDIATVLTALCGQLRPDGRIYMVVGDSGYAGIDVPVAQVLKELAPEIGFEFVTEERFRSMRSMRLSPCQGACEELAERLLVLRRPSTDPAIHA
jgi:hypothetical protein